MHDNRAAEPRLRVLVVCHGNINRSALAASVLALHPELEVRQAALKAWANPAWRPERAPLKMREAAWERHQINLEEHRSRAIEAADLDWAEVVIYMDGGNLKRLNAIPVHPVIGRPEQLCLGEVIGAARVPDPNFMRRGSDEFDAIVDMVVEAAELTAANLIARMAETNHP